MPSLLCAVLFQQTVLKDIHVLAMPLGKVIEHLSEEFGSPMTVSNLIKDRTIFIEANQVSEGDIRGQLAKLLHASWEKKDSGWHLGQDAKQQGILKEYLAAGRYRYLAKTVELRTKSPDTAAPYTSAFATKALSKHIGDDPINFRADEYGTPEQRLCSRILAKLDLRKLAAVPSGERAVFASSPNAMQQPLGVSVGADIEQYRQEFKVYLQAMRNRAQTAEGEVKKETTSDAEVYEDTMAMPDELQNFIVSVFVSREGIADIGFTGIPKDINAPFFSTNVSSLEGALSGFDIRDFIQPKRSKDFKNSPEALEYKRLLSRRWDDDTKPFLPDHLKLFADPVSRDPLTYTIGERLCFDAQKEKKNIVALLADDGLGSNIEVDLAIIVKYGEILDHFVEQESNWIRINDFILGREVFPRHDLKRIIARVRNTKKYSLEDQAEVAALSPRRDRSLIADTIIEGFTQSTEDEGGDQDALRALGLMQPQERNLALSERGIAFGQVNAKLQRHLFECAFYNRQPGLVATRASKLGEDSAYNYEPTLLAPEGIKSTSILRIHRDDQILLRMERKGEEDWNMSPNAWGEMKFQLDHPKEFPSTVGSFTLDTPLSRATRSDYTLRLAVNVNCEWMSRLHIVGPNTGPTFTLRNLPSEFRAEFESGYQRAAKEWKDFQEEQKKNGGG